MADDRALADLEQLLAVAERLPDASLAAALQSIVSRRPEVRSALLNVLRAEQAVGLTPATSSTRSAAFAAVAPQASEPWVGVAGATPLGGGCSDPPSKSSAASVDSPAALLKAESAGYAARAGCSEVGTEHVLAACVFTWPDLSRRIFGEALHGQLLALLPKSGLEKASQRQQVGHVALAWDTDAAALLECLRGDEPDTVFRALEALPDQAAATQLLEMARIFAERDEDVQQPVLFATPPALGASAIWRRRATQCAASAQSREVGTEHFLAASVACFPTDCARILGPELHEQLVSLMEKSRLTLPAESAEVDTSLPVAADATPLLLPNDPDGILQALQELPDSAAASQLLEMAKIFVERS